jgi:DNA polymerase III sliding clamp (beta) subunit (PCNA family)
MRLTVEPTDLARALTFTSKVAPRKSALQSLCGVLIIADGQWLTLVGTNLATGAVYRIPASIEQGGRSLIQAARFAEFIENLSPLPGYQADPIEIEQAPEETKTEKTQGDSSSIRLANRLHARFPPQAKPGQPAPLSWHGSLRISP